ncbi:MAG: sulfite exporter TauE/SafE family protein [Betaproteobacteria bacterium]|nr:sulfite exporter TauE/SafE family protein [Betaproteobacteria bacterium]
MPSIEILIFAPLIVLAAYIIFGISGFGSTLVAIPLLAHLYPIKFVIPMVVLLDCIATIRQAVKLRSGVYKQELLPLLPFMLAGMGAGVFLLIRLPAEIVLLCLGVFVFAYGIYYALRHDSVFRLARWTAAPIGLFAGTTSALFGVGGPLYVMYLTGRGATPDHIRATLPVIFSFTTVGRIALFAATGLFSESVLLTAAALLPMMVVGLYCGNRLHLNLSRENAVRIIGGLLVVSGISLVFRAL